MAWARRDRLPTGMVELAPGPIDPVMAAMERLTATYSGPAWQEEMARARRDFDQSRGRVFEDEPMFEARLGDYLEWYVLDRPLDDGAPPVVHTLQACRPDEGEHRQALRALALSFRGLFEVVEVLHRETLLHDLLRGGLWRVIQEPPLPGVGVDDIFEGRLIPWKGEVRFGPLFCFHPRAARLSILQVLQELGARGTTPEQVLASLAVMRLNHERFRNIVIDRIYSLTWRGGDRAPSPGRGGAERRRDGEGETDS
jgi:hypothetical protein